MLGRAQRGITLVELAIGLAIMSILLSLALPAFTLFLQNTQVKNAAETTLAGINLARVEAVRRNAIVRFQLVSDLTNSCALSASSLNWVVSRGDPSSHCADAPAAADDVNPPTSSDAKIIQKKSAQEGTATVAVATNASTTTIVFNGLGRMVGTTNMEELNFSNPSEVCEHVDSATGKIRCMRIMVEPGGQAKMCDPKLNPLGTDPRRCA